MGSPPSNTVNWVPIMLDLSFPMNESAARERSVGSVVICIKRGFVKRGSQNQSSSISRLCAHQVIRCGALLPLSPGQKENFLPVVPLHMQKVGGIETLKVCGELGGGGGCG